MFTEEHRRLYERDGFFVVDDAVDPNMFEPLLEATIRTKKRVRAGEVDQFTHRAPDGEPWAIRGLFAPELGEPLFAKYLMSEPVMQYVRPFIGSELRLGGVLIFTNPYTKDYGFGWHRDFGTQERDGSYQIEMTILNRPMSGIKWHLAMVDDDCLQLVPGSHKRYRTAHERKCLLEKDMRNADIPGQYTVSLKAGQTAFWSGNTIHRGVMKRETERLTLAGSWTKHTGSAKQTETDKRLKWMLARGVRGALPQEMKPMYDRWRSLQLG
ncbi:MAG: phytanoyl-CoA dioxygenase family protein [Candidatus Latescibacterota bacterium]